MNEDVFNLEIRKFLKHFGVTAQREIERAVNEGGLAADAVVRVRARLEIEPLGEVHVIDGELKTR